MLVSGVITQPVIYNDGSRTYSNYPPDNYDGCYEYPECYMNGGCTSGESFDYSNVQDYECTFWPLWSREYRKEKIKECKWAYCESNNILKYSRNCGVDGDCSYSATADCNSYDGIYNYPDCYLATGGGPSGSSSCASGEGPKVVAGNRYDYGCIPEGDSARCGMVGVVSDITCSNNPAGCHSSLNCAVGVLVHCAEECASGTMRDGRCAEARFPIPSPPIVTCPNNKIEQGEVCDGSNLGIETCVKQGFTGGTLKCSNDCKSFDTRSSCTSACNNNNKIDGNEQCDGYN